MEGCGSKNKRGKENLRIWKEEAKRLRFNGSQGFREIENLGTNNWFPLGNRFGGIRYAVWGETIGLIGQGKEGVIKGHSNERSWVWV